MKYMDPLKTASRMMDSKKEKRMSMKHGKMRTAAAAGLVAAGTGAAFMMSRHLERCKKNQRHRMEDSHLSGSRKTEKKENQRIYYSKGNYEAFACPEKPEGIEEKSAWLIGGGLASLAAACFLIRDAKMAGDKIHILEASDRTGGACDGILDPTRGYIMRGGREMEDHFECLWDLFRSIPSLDTPGISVLDEFYRLNKKDPNYSLCRATQNQGKPAFTDKRFGLSRNGRCQIMKLFFCRDEDLYDKTIEDVFDREVFDSPFWLYWRTMFAFENWHSALELKLYLRRFIHHIGGLADFSALKFTRYNQYESLILPMKKYLEEAGVEFRFGTAVTDVEFEIRNGKKTAKSLKCLINGGKSCIPLTEKDLVFITNGSCTEGTVYGDQDHKPEPVLPASLENCWTLWKNIAAQDPAFGRPEKFCSAPSKTCFESATITTSDETILSYVKKTAQRDPRSGKVVTGGIVTCADSGWLLSWTVNRQGQFKTQKKEEVCIWLYGLFPDQMGDFVPKPMKECTGREITEEWLYHLGVPADQIHELAAWGAVCVLSFMPYITAFFMPRRDKDRPQVIPEGSVNAAFIGQFAQTPKDTVFTTEYSVRTAMEAVYGLCGVDRGVPEVWGSAYDLRELLKASVVLMDGGSPLKESLPMGLDKMKNMMIRKIQNTEIGELLREYGIL